MFEEFKRHQTTLPEERREMKKTEGKPKSGRKPLRELPKKINDFNGGAPRSRVLSKSDAPEKKISSDDTSLDRLLLVHSNLSSLLCQVDELVAQAFKSSPMTKQQTNEIKCFVDVLLEMFSSLKPWVPRLQKVLSSPAKESGDQGGKTLTRKPVSFANEEVSFEVGRPEETKVESLISPSPLVSWRADSKVERGKQLFLLTPLSMSKTSSMTCKPRIGNKELESSPKWLFSPPKSCVLLVPPYDDKIKDEFSINHPLSVISRSDQRKNVSMSEVDNTFADGSSVTPTPNEPFDLVVSGTQKELGSVVVNSPRIIKGDHSMTVLTPHLKMSPPKSCVLLEPIYESSHQVNERVLRSTPFIFTTKKCSGFSDSSESETKNCSGFSDSSESETLEDLALKYPELRGIQNTYRSGIAKKELESSPEWLFSPPKTCVLLVPPNDDSSLDNIKVHVSDREIDLSMSKVDADSDSFRQGATEIKAENIRNSLAHVESTPMWKLPGSTVQRGKRPGESTLKKELWTRFEEASTCGLAYDTYVCQRTVRKGFLDMLDEVSSDERSPISTGRA